MALDRWDILNQRKFIASFYYNLIWRFLTDTTNKNFDHFIKIYRMIVNVTESTITKHFRILQSVLCIPLVTGSGVQLFGGKNIKFAYSTSHTQLYPFCSNTNPGVKKKKHSQPKWVGKKPTRQYGNRRKQFKKGDLLKSWTTKTPRGIGKRKEGHIFQPGGLKSKCTIQIPLPNYLPKKLSKPFKAK